MIDELKNIEEPGLVLFTSGTTSEPKAVLHNFKSLQSKFNKPGKDLITLAFMYLDHIGGIDTVLYTIYNNSSLVLTFDRSVDQICKLIEELRIEVLPTTPSFLKLMIFSEAYKKYDLSSLKNITYGTEPMSLTLLSRLNEIFPDTRIIQKFGTTETGALNIKSESNDSNWIKMGDDNYKVRVNDGLLEIKSNTSMLGYLNYPSPFTSDGWLMTKDQVEVKNDYYRIKGRSTRMINVGGEKVNPVDVEEVIEQLDFVIDVNVFSESNNILGNIVIAELVIDDNINKSEAKKRVKEFCKDKLEAFQIPVKIKFNNEISVNSSFKKSLKNQG